MKEFVIERDTSVVMDKPPAKQKVYFSAAQELSKKGLVHMPIVYRHYVNYIPFPFGISNNQHELLAAHATWGNFRVKLAILTQWIFLQIALVIYLRRKISNIN